MKKAGGRGKKKCSQDRGGNIGAVSWYMCAIMEQKTTEGAGR